MENLFPLAAICNAQKHSDWRQVFTLVNRHGDELDDRQAAAALNRVAVLLERAALGPSEVRRQPRGTGLHQGCGSLDCLRRYAHASHALHTSRGAIVRPPLPPGAPGAGAV